ncbi:ACHE, partial [Cordylochernes scorpioides]
MGLKDQILAFKWVKKYIRIFGGNLNKVTLYGLSSGSMSIAFHLSIAENKKPFQRAFLQSGVSNNPFFHFSKTRIQKGIDLYYQVLNCNPNSSEVLQCLQSKMPEEILKAEEETTKIMNQQYVLGLPLRDYLSYTPKEIKFSNRMMDYVGNFAKK